MKGKQKMNRKLAKQIRSEVMKRRNVERVRFRAGEIHAYGIMPNSNARGWWFVGYVYDVEIKGLDILAM
jgi:lysozyme family protein